MDHRIYHIDSSKRLSSSISNTDFQYIINLPFGNRPLRVLMARCVIPKTFLHFQSDQTIYLNEGSGNLDIVIMAGNYSFRTFASKLKILLDTAGTNTYTVTANQNTGKLEISSDVGTPTLTTNNNQNLSDMLGLLPSTTYTMPFESVKIVQYHKHNTLRIHSNIVSSIEGDILAAIPSADIDRYAYINYTYHDKDIDSRNMISSRSNVYHFRLVNDYDEEINLNGFDWSMDLFIYEDINKIYHDIILRFDDFIKLASSYINANTKQVANDDKKEN